MAPSDVKDDPTPITMQDAGGQAARAPDFTASEYNPLSRERPMRRRLALEEAEVPIDSARRSLRPPSAIPTGDVTQGHVASELEKAVFRERREGSVDALALATASIHG